MNRARAADCSAVADIITKFEPEAADCLIPALEERGADTSTLLFEHHTLGENRASGDWMADGSGVDHLFAAYGPQIGAALEACGAGAP